MANPSWDPNLLFISLFITVGLNLSVFLIAYTFQTDVLTDLTGSLNYIILAISCLVINGEYGTRQIGVVACMCAARTYLGLFLCYRASARSGDARFDNIRPYFFRFLCFWIFQILWVYGTSLPIIYVLSRTSDVDATIADIIAFGCFVVGLIFQSVGDLQKFKFKASGGKGIMKTGLWSISRHPNYFGEFVMWFSVFALFLIQWFQSDDQWWWILVAAISPLWTSYILLFLSGMPTAEGKGLRRIADRGDLEDWNKYASETSPLIPVPGYSQVPPILKYLCCCEFPMYQYKPSMATSISTN